MAGGAGGAEQTGVEDTSLETVQGQPPKEGQRASEIGGTTIRWMERRTQRSLPGTRAPVQMWDLTTTSEAESCRGSGGSRKLLESLERIQILFKRHSSRARIVVSLCFVNFIQNT